VINLIDPSFRQVAIKGKNKTLYATEEKGVFTLSFEEENEDIAILRSKISHQLFSVIKDCSIANHFVSVSGIKEMNVRALEVLPFVTNIYSFTNNVLSKRLFCASNMKLKNYLIELHMKNTPNETLISQEHVLSFGWLTEQEMQKLNDVTKRVMDIFYGHFKALGITITSISLEFGKFYDSGKVLDVLVCDELSPKNISFHIDDKLKCSYEEACVEFATRMGILSND